MADKDIIPVEVAPEFGSAGQPTGKYVFTVDNLHRFYYADFDAGRIERHLDACGYTYEQFRPMVSEMERQFHELQAPAPKDSAKKSPPAPEEPAE